MSYTVIRVKTSNWTDRFKEAETDMEFEADSFPELDAYLSTMEQRGWSVVATAPMVASGGMPTYLYITLHRPDA